jgi:hypothetical protein
MDWERTGMRTSWVIVILLDKFHFDWQGRHRKDTRDHNRSDRMEQALSCDGVFHLFNNIFILDLVKNGMPFHLFGLNNMIAQPSPACQYFCTPITGLNQAKIVSAG